MAATYLFITEADLTTDIQPVFLNVLSQNDDAHKETAEKSAISKMSSYLRNRFDTTLIFGTGDDETAYEDKELVKEYLCNLIRYRLWRSISPRNVGDQVKADYNETMDWLEGIAGNTIHPNLPHLEGDEERRTDQAVWGGENKPTNFQH